MAENRAIGAGGQIPWHLPADFRHFKELTTGHPVIMGRKTFESIGRPLPGRTNIVITRDAGYAKEGVVTVTSMAAACDAAAHAEGGDEAFVIGGAEIYAMFLPVAEQVYLTVVHGAFEGDTFFPELNENEWRITGTEDHRMDEKNPFDYSYLTYEHKYD